MHDRLSIDGSGTGTFTFDVFRKYMKSMALGGQINHPIGFYVEFRVCGYLVYVYVYAGCTHGPWATVLGFGVTRDRKQRTVSVDATRLIRDLAKRRGISTGDKAG